MDLGPCVNKNNTSFLIDSGTESITPSSLNAEHPVHTTIPSIKLDKSEAKTKAKLTTSLIDKSFSIEEDDLCPPLAPIQIPTPLQLTPSPSPSSIASEETSEEEDDDDDDDDDDGIEDIHIEFSKSCLLHQQDEEIITDKNGINIHKENDITDTDLIEAEDDGAPQLTTISEGNNNDTDIEDVSFPDTSRSSILRKSSYIESSLDDEGEITSPVRHVSFPNDEYDLVSYKEPEDNYFWIISDYIPSEDILHLYQDSCKKHKTVELDSIKSQIVEIKNNLNHSATLKLSSIKMTPQVIETLEDILKLTNFHTLSLQECQFTPATMTEFLNILEYYKSACHFEIAMNFDDVDTWKCFCSACCNIKILESLSFRGMVINEPYMRHLLNVIKNNSNISTLKFESCMIVPLPLYIVESLMTSPSIRELYLPSTGLYTKEADSLQRFLVNNTHLKVLDISNNNLGDRGLEVLAKGLCNQGKLGPGLSVLVIFNNQITEKSAIVIKNIIVECKSLTTLNIGYNKLKDEVLHHISDALPNTKSLEGLGLQCTLLTCKGILALSEAIPKNTSLEKINLKGNKAIQIAGVEALCNALTNSKITNIEIDDTNRSCSDPEAYSQLVKKLSAICTINKTYVNEHSDDDDDEDNELEEVLNIAQKISRKVSLSCEPKYGAPDPSTTFQIGSPLPSPASSPAPRSRFEIVKVPEAAKAETPIPIRTTKSRFKVTKVLPSPDEDVTLGRFANIRSSVSSTDSVDSLMTIPLESDSD